MKTLPTAQDQEALLDECREATEQYLVEAMEEHQEYCESHVDSGNSYAHMPRESWIHDNELQAFIDANEIDPRGLDIDQIDDLYLENFEMVSRHRFSAIPADTFGPFSYAIGEIELQFEVATVLAAEPLQDYPESMIRQCLTELVCNGDTTLPDTFLRYSSSDCYWSAELSANELQSLIIDESAD